MVGASHEVGWLGAFQPESNVQRSWDRKELGTARRPGAWRVVSKGGSGQELNGRNEQWVDHLDLVVCGKEFVFCSANFIKRHGWVLNAPNLIKWGIRKRISVMYFIESSHHFLSSGCSLYSVLCPPSPSSFHLCLYLFSFFAGRENRFLDQNPSHRFSAE